jgi:hypothetical protein
MVEPRPEPSGTSYIADTIAKPWHYVGSRISNQRFMRDKNKCVLTALQAPEHTDPDMLFMIFDTCMRAEGYAQ